MTLKESKATVKAVRKNAMPVSVVQTEDEAAELTSRDPLGRIYFVGDRYYKFARTVRL